MVIENTLHISAPSFLSVVNFKFSCSSEHKATNHICMHLFVNVNFSLVNLSLDSEVISSLYIKQYFFTTQSMTLSPGKGFHRNRAWTTSV